MPRRRARTPFKLSLSPAAKIVVVLAGLYVVGACGRLGYQQWLLVSQAQELAAERELVAKQSAALAAQIARAKTREGVEELARTELGLVLPSEIPIETGAPQLAAESPAAASAGSATAARPTASLSLPPALATVARAIPWPWE